MPFRVIALSCGFILAATAFGAEQASFPKIYNTQEESIKPLAPEVALSRVKLPEGFRATLFASEPDINQPIAITTDSRGRLWVAENYTYSEREVNFDLKLRDRLIILKDTDHDGKHDIRTVFTDQVQKLTSVAVGFGGVYALCPPQLLFFPDRDGNDVPDGAPEVLLDGIQHDRIRHTLANGLKWGPDGWLYGRHGIQDTSWMGKPGTAKEDRVAMNVGVWRYHPIKHTLEVVAQGTTNPWGHDWDENGELFFINTVIGHLWHAIPGAYFKRMYGQPMNPFVYEEIEQVADHVHWDTKEIWSDIRETFTATTSLAGGGHAHTGLMIYQGDNWPREFRNKMFTLNYHGKRINHDTISKQGATYVAKHAPDFMMVDDPYFRGIDLLTGPEGAVYVADWSDIGECHDENGIHRTSGRIYRVSHGEPKTKFKGDISKLNEAELVKLLSYENEWYVRQARLVLQERSAAGADLAEAKKELQQLVKSAKEPRLKLRALWALNSINGVDESILRPLLEAENEHLRVWAIRLLVDQAAPSSSVVEQFTKMAVEEKSGLVLTYLASALQRIPNDQKWLLAGALAARTEFANDRVYPLMVWYGIESAIPGGRNQTVNLVNTSKLNKLTTFATRKVFGDGDKSREVANSIIQILANDSASAKQAAILRGIAEALGTQEKPVAAAAWKDVAPRLIASSSREVSGSALELDALFGNAESQKQIQERVSNKNEDLAERKRALAILMRLRPSGLESILTSLLSDKQFAPEAIRALGALGDPKLPQTLLKDFAKMEPPLRNEVVGTLSSRPNYAMALVNSVQRGAIKRQEIGAAHLRQIRGHQQPELKELVNLIWPPADKSAEGKAQLFAKYKSLVTAESIKKADAVRGREVYKLSCAPCHKLYDEGAAIGPELTGSDRQNLDYLFENILNPSSVVPEGYRVSNINMKDDRVLNGMIVKSDDQSVTLQTVNERLVLPRSEIESIKESQLSMMPDGLLESLDEKQVQDLFAYLSSQTLPKK